MWALFLVFILALYVFSLFLPPLLLRCLCSDRKVSGHERSCIYFIELKILSFSTIFLLEFGTASTVWYFFFIFFYFYSFCVPCLSVIICVVHSVFSHVWLSNARRHPLLKKNEYNRKQYSNYEPITSQKLF